MKNIPFHEISNIFPLIHGREFVDLKADIRTNGVHEPIVMYEGQILDGRNRFRACQEVGVTPDFVEYGGLDPVGYVISLNLHRRHLNESQRAMVANNIANLGEGRPSNTASIEAVSQTAAADSLNVSRSAVQRAHKVNEDGIEELIEAVQEGKISVSGGAVIAGLEPEDQEDIIVLPPKEAVAEAKRRAHVSNSSGNNEWYTPKIFIDRAKAVMGSIDLDPASSEIANKTVGANKYYTESDNGLKQSWSGNVWLNPPYAQPLIKQFSDKLCESIGGINQACVLVNNATETKWFQKMASHADAICFTNKRIRFLDPEGNPGAPLQGQAILYFGKKVNVFSDVFKQHGFVVRHV